MRSQPRHYAPKHIILNQSFSSFLGSYLSSRQPWSPASLCSTHPPHLHTDMVGSGSETLSTHPPHLHIHMYIYMQYTSSTSYTHKCATHVLHIYTLVVQHTSSTSKHQLCSTNPPHLLTHICAVHILHIYTQIFAAHILHIYTHIYVHVHILHIYIHTYTHMCSTHPCRMSSSHPHNILLKKSIYRVTHTPCLSSCYSLFVQESSYLNRSQVGRRRRSRLRQYGLQASFK